MIGSGDASDLIVFVVLIVVWILLISMVVCIIFLLGLVRVSILVWRFVSPPELLLKRKVFGMSHGKSKLDLY